MPHADPAEARAWRRRWWSSLSPERKAAKNAVANARATRIRRWLDFYKVEQGCIDCGFNAHPAALDFDHVAGKKLLNVCNAKSVAQAQSEIEKCVVRCANCHRIKSAGEAATRRGTDGEAEPQV